MKPTLLIVEDDDFVRTDVIEIVERAGFQAVGATDADEAIAKLETDASISIVLSDVEMPGSLDGIHLAFIVRERWPDVRILILSARATLTSRDLPKGTVFIAKPSHPEWIVDAIASLASDSGDLDEPGTPIQPPTEACSPTAI